MPNTCEKIQSFKVAFAKLQSEKETFEKRFLEAADAERAAIVQEVAAWKKHADDIYTSFIEFKEYTNHYENKETLWTMDDINLWAKEQLGEDEDWVSDYFAETAKGVVCYQDLHLSKTDITIIPACTYTERVNANKCKKLKKIHNATFTFLSINGADHVSLQGNVYGKDRVGDSLNALDCKELILDGAKFEGSAMIDGSENPSLQNVVWGVDLANNSLFAQNCTNLDTFTLAQKIPGNVSFKDSTHTPHFLETIKKYKADGMIKGLLTLPDGTVIW